MIQRERQQIQPLAASWLESGERGQSSEALCRLFFDAPAQSISSSPASHPRDPSDLRRCVLFLEATGTAGRIVEAGLLSPEWGRLVGNWEHLAGLLESERHLNSSPLTYAAIRKVLEPGKKPKAGM